MKESSEKESLEKQVGRAEQEARMVLPGIQALFGFQLIAVFNAGFFERFQSADRVVHFTALICTALCALLIMTPAAFHRQAERGCASERFVRLASGTTCVSMLFLAISICLDIDLIGRQILESGAAAHGVAVILFLLYIVAWFIFPHLARGKDASLAS